MAKRLCGMKSSALARSKNEEDLRESQLDVDQTIKVGSRTVFAFDNLWPLLLQLE